MGPTPPGTGVINEHFGATSSNFTSPLNRKPLLVLLDGTRVVPTSITAAPSFTISAVRNWGFPNAAIMISACRQISFRFLVRLLQTVTVASPGYPFCIINDATGLPTILLRPITTQFLPAVGISYRFSNSIIPEGVADT